MAEREEIRPEDGPENERPEDAGTPGPAPRDEDAAWAELVAAYDADAYDGPRPEARKPTEESGGIYQLPMATGSIVVRPAAPGPRDFDLAEPSAEEEDADEGHFTPPEPPPLPNPDATTKFAWLAVLGGPLLVLGFILLGRDLPWWAALLGVGGFLGGFATLVTRMRPGGEDDDELPGGGAVV